MSKRVAWIDCTKLIAVIAVAVDHCNGVLYTSRLISYASYFSVSLFILLSGISTWISYENGKNITFCKQFQKMTKLFGLYAIATFVVLCVTEKRFILNTYLGYLFSFNIQGPYYYLVFFIQLLMIAPVFVSWCSFVNSKKYKWVMQMGTMGILGWFAYISVNYTYILRVHGGGKFLGGGHLCNSLLSGDGTGKQWNI